MTSTLTLNIAARPLTSLIVLKDPLLLAKEQEAHLQTRQLPCSESLRSHPLQAGCPRLRFFHNHPACG
jgi:hypothetical protein